MKHKLWELIDYGSGESYYFCNEQCGNSYKEDHPRDFDSPEELEDESLAKELFGDGASCDFCKEKLKV